MATHFSSGQYEDAYNARNLQSWSLPKVRKAHPSAREGFTQFIANDRGHLLPLIPRSKASPWGTYLSTWDMPLRIPPAKVTLTSRSVNAAAHLSQWINSSAALSRACNGLCPQIVGKPSVPVAKEAAPKPAQLSSRKSERPVSTGKMPVREEIQYRGSAIPSVPLSRQPGSMDIRLKEDGVLDAEDATELEAHPRKDRSSSEIPLSRQPGCMDVRLKDAATPKIPAPSRPNSREPNPRRTISAEAPPSARPRSLDRKSKAVSTPELRPASLEANPRNALSPETFSSSRPPSKGRQGLEVQKNVPEMGANRSKKGNVGRPVSSA